MQRRAAKGASRAALRRRPPLQGLDRGHRFGGALDEVGGQQDFGVLDAAAADMAGDLAGGAVEIGMLQTQVGELRQLAEALQRIGRS